MGDNNCKSVTEVNNLNNHDLSHPLINNNELTNCETAEEALTTDSEECLSESLRYRNFQYSASSNNSNSTLVAFNTAIPEETNNYYSYNGDINFNNIQIPIVGYEIMEERARFTVYKLRVENKATGDCWYVFRRYTDFVRLCNRFKISHPQVVQFLPSKRWLKNNFDPIFLDERVNGLQNLVNAILSEPGLVGYQEIQDFFCLNEPPSYTETNEESRAMFEALEETINDLRQQVREKESVIESLQDDLNTKNNENDNLKKIIRNSTMNCQKCQKDYENFTKTIK